MEEIKLNFIQILHKYSETLKTRTGVIATPEEDEWIWLGNEDDIAKDCLDLCLKEMKLAFEAARHNRGIFPYKEPYYETIDEYLEELK